VRLSIIIATIAFCLAAPVQAQEGSSKDIILSFEPGMSLRDLAAQHLGNSDLWAEILNASNIANIADIKPGQKLRIPARIITKAKQALDKSRTRIQDANRAGAQVFAPKLIGAAIEYRNEALLKQAVSEWDDTISLATLSFSSADKAVSVSTTHRDQAAQARLSDRQGNVQGQRPAEIIWGKRKINATLIEEEKIRTLSRATAQITFRDTSRLRLNPNSQAVIQLMRVDPLNNRQQAKVNLINGDFYALLSGISTRKKFQVQLPNVNASVDSGNFWVRQQPGQAKFTNYDTRPIKIAARGETLTLRENEGAVVLTGQAPKNKFDVLPPPILSQPGNGKAVFGDIAALSWNAVDKAEAYWLEIASDPAFNSMIEVKWGEKSPQFATKKLPPGSYYWRVAALDKLGVPGERSDIRHFRLHKDVTPPFLRIDEPAHGAVMRKGVIEIAGETEPGVEMMISNAKLTVDAEGKYRHKYIAHKGNNTVVIMATDLVGNKTQKKLDFIFMPDQSAIISFSALLPRRALHHFLTAGKELSLSGKTTPNTQIIVTAIDGTERAIAYCDENGLFRINVPVVKDNEKLQVRVIAQSQHATSTAIEISRDVTAPRIVLSTPLPRIIRRQSLQIKGETEQGAKLLLNGRPVTLKNGRFDEAHELKDGLNQIEMTATDPVGHVTLEKWTVHVDREAPQFIRQAVTLAGPQADGLISIEVVAKDKSGLARIARYALKAGEQDISGYLRFNRATQSYRGTLQVPAEFAVAAKLVSLELRDDAGNKRVVKIN